MSFKARHKSPPPQDAESASDIRNAAVRWLARRDFASGELRGKLEKQGFDGSTVAAVVAELIEERALDDARYAGNYVSYHAGRGYGPLRIAADLRALGLPSESIEAALASGPDWKALARDIRIRKYGADQPREWPQKAQQARFLQYRGFSSDHIQSALGADFDPD